MSFCGLGLLIETLVRPFLVQVCLMQNLSLLLDLLRLNWHNNGAYQFACAGSALSKVRSLSSHINFELVARHLHLLHAVYHSCHLLELLVHLPQFIVFPLTLGGDVRPLLL